MRKNIMMVILFLVVLFTSCNNKESQMVSINSELNHQINKLNDLEIEKVELEVAYEELSSQYDELLEDYDDIEEINVDLENQISALEVTETPNHENQESLYTELKNVYDPNIIQTGEEINGLKVISVELDKDIGFERVKFDGYFILTGRVMINMSGGGGLFVIYCDNKQIASDLPISTTQLSCIRGEEGGDFFSIDDGEEMLIEELGEERYNSMEIPEEKSYIITAVFYDLDHVIMPNTDWSSGIKMVKLLSIDSE